MEPVKKLPDSEMKLMELIWDSEPVRSGELVSMSLEKHGWKKSTVYTILKKLVNKGFAINEDSVITSTRPREEALSDSAGEGSERSYGGALAMFLRREKLTKKEAEELKKLIDDYTEEG